jgi:predicted ATP-dependent endonuclease of OLD family
LKEQYEALQAKLSDLPKAGSKDANHGALRAYEDAHPENAVAIPSEDQFYGWSKGGNLLAKYIQWVYVPAVKDATDENVEASNTALGKLLARTVRSKVSFADEIKALRDLAIEKYKVIIEGQQGALNAISKALQDRLVQWAHPEATARLAWQEDGKKSVRVEEPIARLIAGEGAFEGELARFGHGLQRCYLLALLQELVSYDRDDAPKLILGCEEPELYQHPPQARHLSSVLEKLSEGNSQIIVTTHSPYFISGKGFEAVRLVARIHGKKYSAVTQTSFDRIAKKFADATGDKLNQVPAQQAKLQQALNPYSNEMFFTRRLILVEGLEDLAYLTTWLILTDRWEEFRARGCHAVPVGGKDKLILPLIIAQEMGIQTYLIADSDGHITNENSRKRHERDNRAILKLCGQKAENVFPAATLWVKGMAMWASDIGHTLKAEVGDEAWDKTYGQVRKALGDPDGDLTKNPTAISDLLSRFLADGIKVPSLDKLCSEALNF